jgi:hypothetical protein
MSKELSCSAVACVARVCSRGVQYWTGRGCVHTYTYIAALAARIVTALAEHVQQLVT